MLALYLFQLGSVGFLSTDEPRYASIGRQMAESGDWITPRLDGRPWFEKPPLLYWTTALGRLVRLPDEWAARLPVALMSVAFLIFFFRVVSREFSIPVGIAATAILSTSAGWQAYSFVAVPDLPMSATLAAAMLLALSGARPERGYMAGALLGLSILAKAFVPLVLFAPVFLFARGRRMAIAAGCVLVAAPWHVLCTLRNGLPFWQEYFWKQQVLRFFTPSLEHVQPFWFYAPVLLAGLFPWTPMGGLLARRKIYDDARVRFLSGWLAFALVFFSIARNKLPGYALPLLPPLAIMLAVALEQAGSAGKWWLAASVLALAALPAIIKALPGALLAGLTKTPIEPGLTLALALPFGLLAAAVWWLGWRGKQIVAILVAAAVAAAGVTYAKIEEFPTLDQRVSARGFWLANQARMADGCVAGGRREWVYGLNYYARRAVPECGPKPGPRIVDRDNRLVLEK